MVTSAPTTAQELHRRFNDGILVRLMWRSKDGHLADPTGGPAQISASVLS